MIWRLLRSIYGTASKLPADLDPILYTGAIEEIDYFHIGPQIYRLLKQREMLEQTPAWFQEQLRMRFDEATALNVYFQYENERIFRAFEAAGIPVIPLKGTTFADRYFGHIGARGTSDIDLLIHKEDLGRAKARIKSLGYAIEEEPLPGHFHHSFSKPLPGSAHTISVELHWDLLAAGTSNFEVSALWKEAQPIHPYGRVMELSEQHAFYMICLHGWKHALNSLKYLLDIVQMIHVCGERIDYGRLFEDATAHRTSKRIASTLSIVYRQFPHLEQMKPLELAKRTGSWWNYDTIRGYEKDGMRRYVRFLQYLWLDFDTFWHGFNASSQYFRHARATRRGVTNDG